MGEKLGPLDKLFSQKAPEKYNRFEAEDKELEEALGHIWNIAEENHLDPFPTKFEVVPPHIINQLGAYGVPGRFSHWTHGRAYRQMKTTYDYGLSKIYELVINSNPSQAYLLENNPPIENKFVMAHVLGHTDFFKNNMMFANTRRDMPSSASRSTERIHSYENTEGREAVEKFLDATLAIDQYIDPYVPVRPSREEELKKWREEEERHRNPLPIKRGKYDDGLEHLNSNTLAKELGKTALTMPPEPDPDLLGFIRNHAPHLQDWQRDTIDIVRDQSVYFYPQRRTKIMNEGWAAYWHKRIMREMGSRHLISDKEDEAWWKVHAHVVTDDPKSLNPYHLGMKMYEYIEDYYNGNLSAKEQVWLKSHGEPIYPHFDGELKDSPAISALRDAMMLNDDQSFIRNHFNKIIADRLNMYVYEEQTMFDGSTQQVIKSTGWQDIRDHLVSTMTNNGIPYITVVDGNYHNASELYLRHEFDGRTLDPDYIQKTLPYIYTLWQKPLHLETVNAQNNKIVYSYNGTKVTKAGIV